MNIAFDAVPLLETHKTGVAYCESGLVSSLIKAHPEDNFFLQCFSLRNHEVKESALSDYTRQPNSRCNICKRFSGRLYLLLTIFLPLPYRWFFREKTDVTHFFNYIVPPFVRGKTVVTVHDLTFITHPETMKRKNRILMRTLAVRSMKRADRIVAVSEFTKSEIVKYIGISPDKIDVVYNAVDYSLYRNDHSPQEIAAVREKYGIGESYFLYLGTLEPRKNLERLIISYSVMLKDIPDAPDLVIAGKKGWLYEKIFETVKSCGISDRVKFTDYVPAQEAPVLMQGARAFVYPSLYEGYGMPPLEAMSCGTPVLTSNCSSLPEVVGDCAVLVDPLSVESITDGLMLLASDDELCHSLSVKGKKRAEKSKWDTESDKLYEIYCSLSDR